LNCYVDADFAGLWHYEDDQDPVCVKSRTGYMLTFGGCPILWVSKLQTEIALSTMEAEYIALAQSMRDLIPARLMTLEVLKTFDIKLDGVWTHSTVFEDNNGALTLANAPKMTPRSKHIGIKYHFFREAVKQLYIHVVKIESERQQADIFTKGLPAEKFTNVRKQSMGWHSSLELEGVSDMRGGTPDMRGGTAVPENSRCGSDDVTVRTSNCARPRSAHEWKMFKNKGKTKNIVREQNQPCSFTPLNRVRVPRATYPV